MNHISIDSKSLECHVFEIQSRFFPLQKLHESRRRIPPTSGGSDRSGGDYDINSVTFNGRGVVMVWL